METQLSVGLIRWTQGLSTGEPRMKFVVQLVPYFNTARGHIDDTILQGMHLLKRYEELNVAKEYNREKGGRGVLLFLSQTVMLVMNKLGHVGNNFSLSRFTHPHYWYDTASLFNFSAI